MEGRQRTGAANVCGRSGRHVVQIRGWRAKTQRPSRTVAEPPTHVDVEEKPVNKLDVAEYGVCKQSCDMFGFVLATPASDLCEQASRARRRWRGVGGRRREEL